MSRRSSGSPVRRALLPTSQLQSSVFDGLGAVKAADRAFFAPAIRQAFGDSLDVDEAFRATHQDDHRWDYLLGDQASESIVAVEPHTAKDDEVATVIRKREAANRQLRAHFRDGARISCWLWVASGTVRFAHTEKVRFQLDQRGIAFVGRQVDAKHLPAAVSTKTSSGKARKRAK